MAKTKKLKVNSASRRKKEVLKAHANSSIRGQFSEKISEAVGDSAQGIVQPKKLTQRLHVKEIKKDLIKTLIFAIFVVIFLIVLKTQNLELNFGIYK